MKPHLFVNLPSELPVRDESSAAHQPRHESGIYRRSAIRRGTIRYELIELLACGGMASVFLAAQCRGRMLDRLVAVKTAHPSLHDDGASSSAELHREARITARVSHPNVVRALDFLTDDDRALLVLEYIEGVSLRDVLGKPGEPDSPVPWSISSRLIHDLLSGLAAVHEARAEDRSPLGVVHRDVAPGNILVSIDGRAILTDFGLARDRTMDAASASTHIEGTLRYLSPEQARGEPIDALSDLFSAGIILFELLTGRRLHAGASTSEILRNACRGASRAPVTLEALEVPPAMREVCARALALHPDGRYASARQFARALHRAAAATVGIASHDDVSQWVHARFGARVDRQRQRVAEWHAGIERQALASNAEALKSCPGSDGEVGTTDARLVSRAVHVERGAR